MTDDPNVSRRHRELLGDFGARPPLVERQLNHGRGWLEGQPLRNSRRLRFGSPHCMRDVSAYAEHVPVEEIEVVNATIPQRSEGHFHDLLCQIFGFRYTAEVP
jgi:hypothetical protein